MLSDYLPAQQNWVCKLPIMQQSVLFAAVRGPDGIRKNHPVKVLLRWYRRSTLLSALSRKVINDPLEKGGGSFTGPFTEQHAYEYCNEINFTDKNMCIAFNKMRKVYLEHVDELPHHFQLHFMHAAQIVGVHHPDNTIANWWREFYNMIVNDMHLFPETDNQMNLRLSDNESRWKEREEVTAK